MEPDLTGALSVPRQSGPAMPEMPEKARLLHRLAQGGFSVPPFLYMPPEAFAQEDFAKLEVFLEKECAGHKVIVRSCHPVEEFFKGGTFESLETYSDLGGVKYARNRIIKSAMGEKQLSILRQQNFNSAPDLDPKQTGVVVMPFLEGSNVMAKIVGKQWEFGYSRNRRGSFDREPYITHTPHDQVLLQLSEDIQGFLGFKCEIEYIISPHGQINVVQAKDISKIDTLEFKEGETAVPLDGLRRIRRRRNYRERPIFVMDNQAFYLELISLCEGLIHGRAEQPVTIEDILREIERYEHGIMGFAMRHERFAVLGLRIVVPDELFQIANHYLDDFPELQQRLSHALHRNLYKVDQFIAEADTLIAKDVFRRNLCSHDAYGINTVRNPIWSVYWHRERHKENVRRFKELGYRTGDHVGIEISDGNKPTVFRF
jgi:hypothetical protein